MVSKEPGLIINEPPRSLRSTLHLPLPPPLRNQPKSHPLSGLGARNNSIPFCCAKKEEVTTTTFFSSSAKHSSRRRPLFACLDYFVPFFRGPFCGSPLVFDLYSTLTQHLCDNRYGAGSWSRC